MESFLFWFGIWGLLCVATPIWFILFALGFAYIVSKAEEHKIMKKNHEEHSKEVQEKIKSLIKKHKNEPEIDVLDSFKKLNKKDSANVKGVPDR